ncbi:acyltransferase family protein [Fructilactobacillus sp. Tb1]|uniref:acyltransferase family protein n=1 Tax=Fructilactobacillus sp. Tb1 TaxID=3422304 RepID=UPI003D296774
MENKKVKHRFITGFTGLRALAVIGVILYHFNGQLFSGGYLGVPIFLTLSGYLVTDHLISEYSQNNYFDYGHFWYKRIKKLYPTLIVMLIITAAYITLFQRNLLANLWQSVITNLTYTYNWYEILNGQSYFQNFAGSESPFTHLWTLAVEGQFYLIWPLIVMLILRLSNRNRITDEPLHKRNVFYVAIILSIISVLEMAALYHHGVDPSRVYYGTDTRMFSILFGSALAVVWPSDRIMHNAGKNQSTFFNVLGSIGLAIMAILVFTVGSQSEFLYRGGMMIFSLATVLIMWAVLANAGRWNKLLTNPVFNWIGSRSYEIYVYQLPVFVFFGDKFKDIADHQISYGFFELLLIVGISELSYRFIQIPFGRYDYKETFDKVWFHLKKMKKIEVVLLLSLVLGIFGIVQSTLVNPHQANHTQLATRIKNNSKKEEAHNKKLAKKIKSNQKIDRPKADVEEFEKEGLTANQLNEASKFSGCAVGDSVMLSGRDELQKIFPRLYIDAAVSRQSAVAVSVLQNLKSKGLMGNNIIIGLGTNGDITDDTLQQIMKIAGPKRHVYWINVHVPTQPWQNADNDMLNNAKGKYHNLTIIDWNDYIKDHPEWLYDDQTHPNPNGAVKYASFIAKNILPK